MNGSKQIKKRKLRLFNENNRCYYCNQPTVLIVNNKFDKLNQATIEHLVNKYSHNRKNPNSEQRTVLSCYFCNNLMNKIDQRIIHPNILTLKSYGFI